MMPVRNAPSDQGQGQGQEGKDMNVTEDADGMDIFNGIIPVPMETPGGQYGSRKPWCA